MAKYKIGGKEVSKDAFVSNIRKTNPNFQPSYKIGSRTKKASLLPKTRTVKSEIINVPKEEVARSESRQRATPKRATQQTRTAPTTDLASETRKLREAQQAASINAIRERERKALAGLEGQRAEIAPAFQGARSATTSSSELAGKRFRERTAGQGLSGAGVEADIRRTGALQRDIGGLRQQEAKRYSDIARTRADLGRAAESDIAQAKMGIQAQSIQDLINIENQRKQQAFQMAGLTGMYGGQQTMAGRQADETSALRGLQTQESRIGLERSQMGLEQSRLQNLVNQNMGNLMLAMEQYPVGSPEYNALRVAREEKIRGIEQREREAYSFAQETESRDLKLQQARIDAQYEPYFKQLQLEAQRAGLDGAIAETEYLQAKADGYGQEQAANIALKKAQASSAYSAATSRKKADELATEKFAYQRERDALKTKPKESDISSNVQSFAKEYLSQSEEEQLNWYEKNKMYLTPEEIQLFRKSYLDY